MRPVAESFQTASISWRSTFIRSKCTPFPFALATSLELVTFACVQPVFTTSSTLNDLSWNILYVHVRGTAAASHYHEQVLQVCAGRVGGAIAASICCGSESSSLSAIPSTTAETWRILTASISTASVWATETSTASLSSTTKSIPTARVPDEPTPIRRLPITAAGLPATTIRPARRICSFLKTTRRIV